ncbi:hypothetical protein WJX82_000349 [Trebouxia sp. C0006]
MTECTLPARGEKLTLVLAVGSNAAPTQLACKFTRDHFPRGVVIPVLRCILLDFDVVYAPTITSYGSCPATLEHSPGTAVAIFVTYLRPELRRHMHASEGVHKNPPVYNFCHLAEVKLFVGPVPVPAWTGTSGLQKWHDELCAEHPNSFKGD